MKPSIGRIVHYQSYGTPGGEYLPEPRAAVIAAVVNSEEGSENYGMCDIVVFNPSGLFFNRCPFSEEPKPGHWNWPPRV